METPTTIGKLGSVVSVLVLCACKYQWSFTIRIAQNQLIVLADAAVLSNQYKNNPFISTTKFEDFDCEKDFIDVDIECRAHWGCVVAHMYVGAPLRCESLENKQKTKIKACNYDTVLKQVKILSKIPEGSQPDVGLFQMSDPDWKRLPWTYGSFITSKQIDFKTGKIETSYVGMHYGQVVIQPFYNKFQGKKALTLSVSNTHHDGCSLR